jgi:hypothetical protein
MQKISGYKGKIHGGVIGFDFELADTLFGIAYANSMAVVKYQNTSQNTVIKSHIASIYMNKELKKDFVLSSIWSVSYNYISHKLRSLSNNKHRVSNNYKNNSYHIETQLSYKLVNNQQFSLVPIIGINYDRYKYVSYSKSNVVNSNKWRDTFTGIVGTKLYLAQRKLSESITITPEFKALVARSLNQKNKNNSLATSNAQQPITDYYAVQPKTSYILGAGFNAQRKNIKISAGYNTQFHGKYRSQQVFINVVLKF